MQCPQPGHFARGGPPSRAGFVAQGIAQRREFFDFEEKVVLLLVNAVHHLVVIRRIALDACSNRQICSLVQQVLKGFPARSLVGTNGVEEGRLAAHAVAADLSAGIQIGTAPQQQVHGIQLVILDCHVQEGGTPPA